MPNIYQCQVTKSDILQFEVLNDMLVLCATKSDGINIFDSQQPQKIHNITNKYINSDTICSTFSPNAKMYACVINQTIHIISLDSQQIVQSIQTDGEDINIICFDLSSTYLIAGTKNGRVLQYKYNSSSQLSRLYSFAHTNYVSALAFYGTYMACSDSSGTISIIDLRLGTTRATITHNKNCCDSLYFLNEDTIISGNSRGDVSVTSLNDVNNFNTIKTSLSSIKQIVLMKNSSYIMVVGSGNIISIIDINKYKITHSKYIELESNIKKIALVNAQHLIVAMQNNKILHVDLPDESRLRSLILHNSIEEAFELIVKEPMLVGSYEYTVLQEKFEQDYLDATKALINKNEKGAVEILNIYKNVKSKRPLIRDLFSDFKNYARFKELIHDNKYALSYAMSFKFPSLKKTAQYKRMEHKFNITFLNAQKLVLNGNINDARTILSEYNTVLSKKPIIKMILTHNSEYREFLQAVQERRYKRIYELIKINELFKQIPDYISLLDEIDNSLKSIESNIKNEKVDIAQEQLLALKDIPHVEHRVTQLYTESQSVVNLQRAYKNSDFNLCYTILDSHKSLFETQLGILLENHYSKIINQCEEYALKGNIRDIKKTLGELISLPTRKNRVGNLLRVSFHVKIKQSMAERDFRAAELIIYSYIDIFGLDVEINKIMKNYERSSSCKLAITHKQNEKLSLDSWLTSDIVKDYS